MTDTYILIILQSINWIVQQFFLHTSSRSCRWWYGDVEVEEILQGQHCNIFYSKNMLQWQRSIFYGLFYNTVNDTDVSFRTDQFYNKLIIVVLELWSYVLNCVRFCNLNIWTCHLKNERTRVRLIVLKQLLNYLDDKPISIIFS